MKKTLLALAVAALSTSAFAADVDHFTAPANPDLNVVATDVVAVSGATDLATTDTVSWPLGFSITDQNLVRVDLVNGQTFTAAPELEADTVGGPIPSSIAQGGVGQSFVVFQFAPGSTAAFNQDAALTFAGLTVSDQSDINVRYRLYSSQPDAAAGNANTLVDKTYGYAKFGKALVFASANPGVSRQIDVAQESKYFDGGPLDLVADDFGGLNLNVVPNAYGLNLSGPALTLTNLLGTTASITVSGDYSAVGAFANQALDGLPGVAVNPAKTAVTFNLAAAPAVMNAGELTYEVTGNTAIAPSEFNAKLNLGNGAQLLAAPADVQNFATLAKNGSTQYVDLALKPGGAYSNYVRISNKSNTAGKVFLTVIADDGAQATIALNDVAGQPAELAARSSTTQITIDQIFSAAAAKGLALSGDRKLRLVVDGEFKAGDHVNSNDYGLSVQTYTVATDGTTFSTF